MLISFVWLYMFKCDVFAQLLVDQTQKDFWVFYMFLKVILYFRVFNFFSKCIFVFFFKNWFRGNFARSLRLRASRETSLREINFFSISYRKSHYCLTSILRLKPSREMIFRKKIGKFSIQYRGYRDCFMTKSFLWKLLCFSWLILRLPNPWKTRVFSFIW